MLNHSDDILPSSDSSADESVRLFRASIVEQKAEVVLEGNITQQILFSGEILVAGQSVDNNAILIQEIRHITLWSEGLPESGGMISLSGPTRQLKIKSGTRGTVENFEAKMYYPLLGDMEPACQEEDASHPKFEQILGNLSWEPARASHDDVKRPFMMQIDLMLDQLQVAYSRTVKVVKF